MTATDEQLEIEPLLDYLKANRGFDFTGYKRATLTRRINRRLTTLGIGSAADYLDHLQVHPEEFTALFNTILINVTEFFRDPEAWDYLRSDILPALLAAKAPSEPIRVWTAGCASGEEAYSLAMVLCEALGVEDYRERVKIYATDVDEEALTQARHAIYTAKQLHGVPDELVERYFEQQEGTRYAFRRDLRRSVILGRNDLVQDAPISRIDLLVCRNVLMYFTAETQARILRRFHFALAPGGVLFFGKAELLLGHGALFTPVDGRRRFFRKTPGSQVPDGAVASRTHDSTSEQPLRLHSVDRLPAEAILALPMPLVVVAADGRLASASRQAEVMFGVSARDLGRPFRDLELSYRPAELRGPIESAQRERRTVRLKAVEWLRGSEIVHLEIQVTPLVDRSGDHVGVSVVFHDISEAHRLRADVDVAHRRLETAYEELQSTTEELETTNEELQSTVEELETTNEELQSTNEELETMNEELQSTNDELQTINDILRERTEQLDDLNDFFESVLAGLRAAVAVVDRDLRIQVWNRRAEDLWGLRTHEAVGQHFLTLDIGLEVGRLRTAVLDVVTDDGQGFDLELSAINRFGRPVTVRVLGSPLRRDGGGGDVRGAILLMETHDGDDDA